MRLIAAAVTVLALLAAAPAEAHTTLTEAPRTYQGAVDRALLPTPDFPVRVIAGRCGDHDGCAQLADNTITVDPAHFSPFLVMHELYHLLDYRLLTDAERAEFQRITRDTRPWGLGDEGTPAECFASAAAYLATMRERDIWVPQFRDDNRCVARAMAHRREVRWLVRGVVGASR